MKRLPIPLFGKAASTFFLIIALALFCLSTGALCSDFRATVFILGDDVTIAVPDSWQHWYAVDVEGKEIKRGEASKGTAELGKAPIGYYEIRQTDGPGMISAAVLPRIAASDETPIALDAAISWFYADPKQIQAASRLCRIAGVKWIRDRLSWPEIQPEKDKWSAETRYELAMRLQREAGLKILQVNHASPAWANENQSRFPQDLRHVYEFYKKLAMQWKGLIDAIEPWNEPDILLFGGHTGSEIASFQKAAYLGLKAGDPDLLTCHSCFAIDRAETLNEFAANEVTPYFDRYTLHHYVRLPLYERAYGRHRETSGGRPMWTTEFNLPVHWSDEATKEPSEEELRMQSYRVGKVFSTALYQGTQKAFYFILGDYVERNIQYGLVRKDLTPRPAYVAFAAAGRLLNAAKPLGRVNLGDDKLFGYAFETNVDNAERITIVAWSESKPTTVAIPGVERAYDCYGRDIPTNRDLKLSRETVYLLMPRSRIHEIEVSPPPTIPTKKIPEASPVVLQLLGNGNVNQSAFEINDDGHLRLVAYNFSDQTVIGHLDIEGATGNLGSVEILSQSQREWKIGVTPPTMVAVRGDFGSHGKPLVAAKVIDANKQAP